jgi:DNA (cytosine-5)-methyltransferase 1
MSYASIASGAQRRLDIPILPVLPRKRGMFLNYFAGFGGLAQAVREVLGCPPHVNANHAEIAVQVHDLNFPEGLALHCDVRDIDPLRDIPAGEIEAAWFSPDCRHFSDAKNAKPLDKGIRGLAWVALRVAAKRRPGVIFLENVPGFLKWGPLNRSHRPIKKKKGVTFARFVSQLRGLGYVVEWRVLDAADFGTPSFRERLVIIARCDGKPIGWPTPTHGPGRRRPYVAAETCIEWDRPVRSIFDREKLPAPKSQERIAVGIKRFVLSRPPLIRNGLAWAGFVRGYGERPGQETRTLDLAGPLHTIVAGGVKDGLIAVWLIKHYTGVFGVPLTEPMGTITARDHHALGAVYLTRARQERTEAWLRSMLGDIDLTVRHDGETWRIADVGTRMLAPTELLRGMGFPEDFQLVGTQQQQTAGIGNAVPIPLGVAVLRANLPQNWRAAA